MRVVCSRPQRSVHYIARPPSFISANYERVSNDLRGMRRTRASAPSVIFVGVPFDVRRMKGGNSEDCSHIPCPRTGSRPAGLLISPTCPPQAGSSSVPPVECPIPGRFAIGLFHLRVLTRRRGLGELGRHATDEELAEGLKTHDDARASMRACDAQRQARPRLHAEWGRKRSAAPSAARSRLAIWNFPNYARRLLIAAAIHGRDDDQIFSNECRSAQGPSNCR